MRVLLDMNMSPRLVPLLMDAGIEALAWSSVGVANEADPKIMAYAASHSYVVLTNDLDFGLLLVATNAILPSVVQVRLDNLDPGLIGGRILEVLSSFQPDLAVGRSSRSTPKRPGCEDCPSRRRANH